MWGYRLPPEYGSQDEFEPFVDRPTPVTYQPHVYALAVRIAERSGAARIVDIGCGNGEKLAAIAETVPVVGVDAPHAADLIRQAIPDVRFIEADLEEDLSAVPDELFRDAVVLCADVLEHLRKPERLAADLARIERLSIATLISTPDRARARGLGDDGPPANPAHCREWTADEFVRFLMDCGFERPPFAGYTAANDVALVKSTTLVMAGRQLRPVGEAMAGVKVAAVINTFNERDIILEVLRHLQRQGVEAHVFDNWSTDGTFEALTKAHVDGLCTHLERFPAQPTKQYLWADQLRNVEAYAASLDADWVLHYDADELRYSPWPGVSLRAATGFIDRLGYSAIDFTIANFRFTTRNPKPKAPYERSLLRFEFGGEPGDFRQIKGWKNTGQRVRLAESGGHGAAFEGRRVFPLNFLTKHYSMRTAEQANRKVFAERLPRFVQERAARGWHTHYDRMRGLRSVHGWPERRLIGWEDSHFAAEYLVERLSGIGVFLEETSELGRQELGAEWYFRRSQEIVEADGQLADAVLLAERAVEQSPTDLRLLFQAASLHEKAGNLEGAERALLKARELYPQVPRTHLLLGNVLARAGRTEGAIAAVQEAVRLAPDNAAFHVRLGNLLKTAGQFEQAEAALSRAVDLDPELPNAHFALSVLLVQLRRSEGALEASQRAVALAPNDERFREHFERLEARLGVSNAAR